MLEAECLMALCEQIIPADKDPGATVGRHWMLRVMNCTKKGLPDRLRLARYHEIVVYLYLVKRIE